MENNTTSIFCLFRSAAKPFIGIRSQQKDTSPDGSYTFSYETENGISVSESGYPQVGPQGQTEVIIVLHFYHSHLLLYLVHIYILRYIFLFLYINFDGNFDDRWSRADSRIPHLTAHPSLSSIQLTRMAFTLRVPIYLRRPPSRRQLKEHSQRIRPDPMTKSTIGNRFNKDSADRCTTPILTEDSNFAAYSSIRKIFHGALTTQPSESARL